jgi:hypothetical protein
MPFGNTTPTRTESLAEAGNSCSKRSITFVANFWCELARYVGGHSENVLLGAARMFLALCVVVFPMMFGRGAMGLGGILVMFGCIVVGIFRHGFPPVSVG